jgi:putative endonuclease
MPQHVVYILQSSITEKYYCGQTNDLQQRLLRHNASMVKSTKHGVPWKVIGFVLCNNRSEAVILEKKVKARGISRWVIENTALINQ